MRNAHLIDTATAVALIAASVSLAVIRYLASRTWRAMQSHSPGRSIS